MIRKTLSIVEHPKRVLLLTLQYAFRSCTKLELNAKLSKKEQLVANSLLASGQFIKNCKLYFYKCLFDGKANYKNFEISLDDAKILRSCVKLLKGKIDASWPAKSLEEFNQYLSYISSKELDQYMGRFISKKLYFLVSSYGLSYHDIKTDMISQALSALYKVYPKIESEAHAKNLVKHAIHNAGIGIILYHTKQCRNQLYIDSEGLFQHKVRDISSLTNIPYEDCNKDRNDAIKIVNEITSKMVNKNSKLFMALATGKYHLGFSTYIGMDNRDYLDRFKYTSYIKKVREYLGIDKKRVEMFFNKLRQAM